MSDEINVVIADDHPIFRRGLRQSLEESEGTKVVGEAGNGKAALEMIRTLNPDVAILDISMPGMDGFAVAREVAKLNLNVSLIFLTGHQEEALFDEAMDLGVKGYVLKESSLAEIATCVQAVFEGKHYTSPALTSYLVSRGRAAKSPADRPKPSPGLKDLTATERKIIKLIAEYKTSREIADELFISHYTVETHRRNICEKLDLHGSHALMKFALAHTEELS